jgi:hypothetical protein
MSDFDHNQPQPTWGDTQPQMPANSAGDLPPAVPVPPVPYASDVPPSNNGGSRGRRTVLAIAGAVVAVLIILAATLFAFAKQRGASAAAQTPAQIISQAKQAKINDATYTLAGQFGVNIGGASTSSNTNTSLPLTGSGKFTTNPARNDVSLSLSILSTNTSIEAITDGSNAYVKVSGLSGLTGQPDSQKWYEVSLGQSVGTPDISQVYDAIQNPTLVGTETVNGHKTWHLTGTLNESALAGSATVSPGVAATATAIAQQIGLATTGTTKIDLWVAQDTYYLVQVHINVSASIDLNVDLSGLTGITGAATLEPTATSGTPTPTNFGFTVDAMLTFQTWNSGISIAVPPPSDVTTVPSGFPGLPTSSPTPPNS